MYDTRIASFYRAVRRRVCGVLTDEDCIEAFLSQRKSSVAFDKWILSRHNIPFPLDLTADPTAFPAIKPYATIIAPLWHRHCKAISAWTVIRAIEQIAFTNQGEEGYEKTTEDNGRDIGAGGSSRRERRASADHRQAQE
jgi:hypothetical protein